MGKFVRDATGWKPVVSGGFYVKAASGMKQVDNGWVWDGVQWKKYYTKAVPVVLTATVNAWDKVTLTWTSIAPGATYIVKRGSTVIYNNGTGLTVQDTLLNPDTAYTYTVEAYLSGAMMSSQTKTATTSSYPDLGLTANTASYSQINLAWSAANGSVDSFDVWQVSPSVGRIYVGTGTSFFHAGLVSGTGYSYELNAYRSGVIIKKDTASATTSSRPTSSASWYGPAAITSGGWTSCSAQNLGGPNFPMPVNGYVTAFNVMVWSYGSATGNFNPHLGGHYFGSRNCPGGRNYQGVDTGNYYLNAGTYSTGAAVGGNCSYSTEWDAYSGATWNYHVAVGQVNYWWYTALSTTFRDQPWWDGSLEDRDIHMDSWGTDKLTKVVITDKRTKSVLVDWKSKDHDDSLYQTKEV
jgi:hypothetical protein